MINGIRFCLKALDTPKQAGAGILFEEAIKQVTRQWPRGYCLSEESIKKRKISQAIEKQLRR